MDYKKLTAFLKRKSEGFRSKKSKVFTTKDVNSFLQNATDDKYLLMKVILILGVNGACRSQEIVNIKMEDLKSNRFLVQYRDKKCTKQLVGKNKVSIVVKEIASYLNLPNPQEYTGHCFRRTSATILADTGADLTTIKLHGGWKSSTVAEGYIENSIENKIQTNNRITESITAHQDISLQPSTSAAAAVPSAPPPVRSPESPVPSSSAVPVISA